MALSVVTGRARGAPSPEKTRTQVDVSTSRTPDLRQALHRRGALWIAPGRPHALRAALVASSMSVVCMTACQNTTPEGEASPTPSLTSVVLEPVFGDSPEVSAFAAEGELTAMASLEGDVYVGTKQGLFRLEADALVPVEVIAEAGEPDETGAIQLVSRRADGLLVVGEQGLFHTYASYLVPSPLQATLEEVLEGQALRALAAAGEGEDETLWLGTDGGLLRLQAGALERLSIPGATGAVQAVGATTTTVIATFDSGTFELQASSNAFTQLPPLGQVNGIRARADQLYLATDQGLVVRDEAGAYWDYTFGADGSTGQVQDVAFDVEGNPVVLDALGLLRLTQNDPQGILAAEAGGKGEHLALDTLGNIWVGAANDAGFTLTGVMVGQPVSFAQTVGPLFQARCDSCHLEGAYAPKHNFANYDEIMPIIDAVLERVFTGNMPSTGALPPEEFEAVVLWNETGREP